MAVGINIAYTLLAGQAAKAFYDLLCSYGSGCPAYGQSAWIVTIGAAVMILSLVSVSQIALLIVYCQYA